MMAKKKSNKSSQLFAIGVAAFALVVGGGAGYLSLGSGSDEPQIAGIPAIEQDVVEQRVKFGQMASISSDLGPAGQAQNEKANRQFQQMMNSSPRMRAQMAKAKKVLEGDKFQQIQLYNETLGQLSSCAQLDGFSNMRQMRENYTRKNKKACDHWRTGGEGKSMLERAENGELSRAQLLRSANRGRMQEDALARMSEFSAGLGAMDSNLSTQECARLRTDVRTGKRDLSVQTS